MNFVLPGTHCTFFPWVPPPRLPDSILLKLQNELLATARKAIVSGHSRHSSASSATSDVDRSLTEASVSDAFYNLKAIRSSKNRKSVP